MAGIAITRMYGAGAEEIARSLAEALDATYLDRAIITRAARQAGVTEDALRESQRVPSFIERIAEILGKYPSFEMMMSVSDSSVDVIPLSNDAYRRFVEDVIRTSAQNDTVVIVGHGAPVLLRDRPDILRVFIHGSRAGRLERLTSETKLGRARAEKDVQRLDQEWGDYLRSRFKVEWRSPDLYDLALNTDHVSIPAATQMILAAYQGR